MGYDAILMNVFKKSAIPVFRAESEALAEKMVKDIKKRLSKQLFNHAPLSPKYRERKIKFGYDPRILIASKQYYNSITVIKTEYGAKVGVKEIQHYPNLMQHDWQTRTRNAKRRKSRQPSTIPMLELAKYLEFGTTRPSVGRGGPKNGEPWYMPPRPHWRPVMSRFVREHKIIKANFTKAMVNAIQKAIATELANATTREERIS